MRGINKVILIGNVGQEPAVSATQSNAMVVRISVATSESWKDKDTGEQREHTEWHKCTAFTRMAEIVHQYVRKGSHVYIEGHLKTNKWVDQAQQTHYSTEIIIDVLRVLDKREDNAPPQQQQQQYQNQQYQQPPSASQNHYPPPPAGPETDDIPF